MEEPTATSGSEVIFKPNPGPQTDFLAASEQEVLYGGAAGGGKSYAMIADPMRYFYNSYFRGLLLRKTTEELRELISISKQLYPRIFKGAKFVERDKTWYLPSGATLWMSYLERDDDVSRYQGQAFSWIGFDELTHWATPYPWQYLSSRLRTTAASGLPLCMRACVDEGEVLTKSGWKDIVDVKKGEFVYSLLESGELVLREVTGFHEYDVEEDLVKVRKKNLFMSMTPDHRVAFSRSGSDKVELVRFNEHKGKSINILRTSADYKKEGYQSPTGSFSGLEYAEFLGLYVAEGCTPKPRKGNYKVLITQNKEENQAWVRGVMEKSGHNVCYCSNGDFQITNKSLYEHLKPLGKAHEKHFPRDFLDNASREQLETAFNAYAKGDGHWQSDKSCTLVTCSKQLADDIQEMAVKLGYRTCMSHKEMPSKYHNDRYTVYVSLRSQTTKVDKDTEGRNDTSYEKFKGKVYCLSVEETENFVLRQKGFVWVSGNTTNPGGPGHAWVKKMFIDPAPWGEAFWATDPETGKILTWPENHSDPDKAGKPLFKRRFIPAKLADNPYIYEDGNYEANLLSLPEHERERLLGGSWDILEGVAFPEWNRQYHICEPFEIPDNWPRFRSCDYGYNDPSSVVWFAVSPTSQLFVYREIHVNQIVAEDLAVMIAEAEGDERVSYGIMDSSMWNATGESGPSRAEKMNIKLREHGKRGFRKADRSRGSRLDRKNEFHRRLKVIDDEAGIIFFNNCVSCISTIPTLQLDKRNPEDVDTKADDHDYDAVTYGIMTRPLYRIVDNAHKQNYVPASPIFGY